MALTLDLTYSQSNDAETLTLTDNAGTYVLVDNESGWETGGATNPDVADIVAATDTTTGSKYHLVLDITVTDKEGNESTYSDIDLYQIADTVPFTDASDLVFPLTADTIATYVDGDMTAGTAMGSSGDMLDDGVYELTYTLRDNAAPQATVATMSEDIVVDGDVRIDVYNKLRQIQVDYDFEDVDTSRDVMEALLSYSYLQSIEAASAVAMTEELVNMLYTLDKLSSDGSHYTW